MHPALGTIAALSTLLTPAGGFSGAQRHATGAPFRVGAAVASITPPPAGARGVNDTAHVSRGGGIHRRPGVRVRGAVHRHERQRPLRRRRALSRLQPQLALGREPARRGRLDAAVLQQGRGPGAGPRDGGRRTGTADRGRGARSGGAVRRLPGCDPGPGRGRRLPPRRDLHLGHPRRVRARQPRPRWRDPGHLRCQRVLDAVHGRPGREGDRAAPTARCGRPTSGTPRCSSRPTCASAGPRTRSSTISRSRCSRRSTAAGGRSPPWPASASTPRRSASTAAPRLSTPSSSGCRRTGSTSCAPRSSSISAAWRSRWPARSARSRVPRCTAARSVARPRRSSTRATPPGCRTLFTVGGNPDTAGALHVPIGYTGETQAFGQQIGQSIVAVLRAGAYQVSRSNQLWGARASICVPLDNALFSLGASLGVFAARPGYNSDCTQASPVLPNGVVGRDGAQIERGGIRDRRCRVHLDARRGVPVHVPARVPRTAGHARPDARRCRRGCSPTCTRRSGSSTASART